MLRQSELNRASSELTRSLEAELEALAYAIEDQLDLLAAVDERLHALELARRKAEEHAAELERRLARLEVGAVTLARRSGGGG